ncbi:MAG: tRNA lysidine(34) synthetase TilS [Bacteroidetes bacterium]|nr:tRNA lysidine(34) synthetase TilS [Bacteroidota bacterium]
MERQFIQYIKEKQLFNKKSKLLLALSGGMDSMVLCHLLQKHGFSFSIAHANFLLRGEESDADEKMVRSYAKKNKIPAFFNCFNTSAYAEQKNSSIQMAARELRYAWFNELMEKEHFDYLLTAHHADDNLETFFINLLRGSGLKGLKSMEPKNNKVLRPLLFASKKEIEIYCNKHRIPYREDSSNKEDKYLRNHLRLHIIPKLKKINPSLLQTFAGELDILQQSYKVIQKESEKQKKKLGVRTQDGFSINIKKLLLSTAPTLFLFELLQEFSFNPSQVHDVFKTLNSPSGKIFESPTHILLKDRENLFVKKKQDKEDESAFFITRNDTEIQSPISISISFKKGNIKTLNKNDFAVNKLYADADTLKFPLLVNHWQKGDVFKPLGMHGFKKVSDFFISKKTSLFDKQKQWILRSNNEIVWLLGSRSDDRYKVTEVTKRICVIELKE